MDLLRSVAIVIVGVFTSSAAKAADPALPPLQLAPRFAPIGSANEGSTSTLSAYCTGTSPYAEIQCSFIQLRLKPAADEKLWAATTVEVTEQMKQISRGDLRKNLAGLCRDPNSANVKSMRSTVQAFEIVAKVGYAAKAFEAACACLPMKEDLPSCVERALVHEIDKGKVTCRITSMAFTKSFMKSDPNKWISVPPRPITGA